MKLTFKIFFVLGLLVVAMLALSAWVQFQREVALFDSDMRQDALHLGHALKKAVSRIWQREGEPQALAFLEQINEKQSSINVRWVWTNGTLLDPHHSRGSTDPLEIAREGQAFSKPEDSSNHGPGALTTYVPLTVPGFRPGTIEISESLTQKQHYIRTTLRNSLLTTALLASGCALIALVFGIVFVGRPVRMLVEKARCIGSGDLGGPLEAKKSDELGELAREMNAMCDRLAEAEKKVETETAARISALDQLRHADRLMTVGKLASGIAHELGTPLSVVAGRAQMIATGEVLDDEARDSARIIAEQVPRMTKIIRQLLDFTRRQPAPKGKVDLRHVAAKTLTLLRPMAEKQGIDMYLASDETDR